MLLTSPSSKQHLQMARYLSKRFERGIWSETKGVWGHCEVGSLLLEIWNLLLMFYFWPYYAKTLWRCGWCLDARVALEVSPAQVASPVVLLSVFLVPRKVPAGEGSTNISFKALVHLRPHHIMNMKIMTFFSYILQSIQVIFFTFLIL